MTREEGINQVEEGGGHVVILGAGASIASTHNNPEASGRRLPSMDNFIEIVGLEGFLKEVPEQLQAKNFETLYSKLYKHNPQSKTIKLIEEKIHNYFAQLALPESPTIYDYLVLS